MYTKTLRIVGWEIVSGIDKMLWDHLDVKTRHSGINFVIIQLNKKQYILHWMTVFMSCYCGVHVLGKNESKLQWSSISSCYVIKWLCHCMNTEMKTVAWICMEIDISKVNIWYVNCARATAFIFDTRTDVLVKVSKFLRQKMSRPEGRLIYRLMRDYTQLVGLEALLESLCHIEEIHNSKMAAGHHPISKQEDSAPISCWVTFDPAESPIFPGQNMLCTYASEYNP